MQVLSAEVIRSLPNANVADALGRLPSVTLERDEGEGKYVQIRGTEPRLSNMTIDGVNIPSPESGVRQIKMDTLASDLVESVEINKTLQANMDGDGIGGSVNLRTKTAGEQPTMMMSGLGGFTPIIGGRGASQFDTTIGKRFGSSKQFGALIGATYDWNGRGINDIEPSPTVTSLSPHYDSIDLRDYKYYRTRWGVTGSGDYRLNNSSSLFLRGLYSTFRNWGQKGVFTLNDGDVPAASIDWRRPETSVGNIVASGHHTMGLTWLMWDGSVSRSRSLGGSGGANFKWSGANPNCEDDPAVTTDANRPQFSASCYAAGPTNAIDIGNYALSTWQPPTVGESAQLNLQGSAAVGKSYKVGERFGTLEFGGKIRHGHKDNNTNSPKYTVIKGVTIPVAQFAGSFTDPNYYEGSYPWPSKIPDFTQIQSYVGAHPEQFTFSGGPGPNKSSFDLTERVTAGYVMNSMDLAARVRLVAGVRIESTHVDTRSFQTSSGQEDYVAGGDYTDVLPSAALKFATSENANIRLVYSRALSRPNPGDISKAVGIPNLTQNPPTVSLGNPNLKPEHANNYDILFEQYFKPLGVLQAGYFYKSLTDPIIATQARPTSGEWAGFLVSQPGNAGDATCRALKSAYQQHLSFPAWSAGRVWLVGQLQLHDVAGARRSRSNRQPTAAASGAEHVEYQPDVRSRTHVDPPRPQLQRRQHLRLPVPEPEQRRHADGCWRSHGGRNGGPRRRQLPVRTHADRRAGGHADRAQPLSGRVRVESEQRSVRVLQRQPAVRCATRVLQADVCGWFPAHTVNVTERSRGRHD